MLPGETERDILPLRDGAEALNHAARQHIQVDRRFCEVCRALVQPGKLDDVVDQIDQTAGFPVNVAGEFLHLFLRDHPLLHKLGKAGDGGQRRFQLMRNIGREFAAQRLTLFALGHVHEDHDRARHAAAGNDRIGIQLPRAAAEGKLLVAARSIQRSIDQRQKLTGADGLMQIFRLRRPVNPQQTQCAAVAGKNVALIVDDQKALAHILRDRVKLALPR